MTQMAFKYVLSDKGYQVTTVERRLMRLSVKDSFNITYCLDSLCPFDWYKYLFNGIPHNKSESLTHIVDMKIYH